MADVPPDVESQLANMTPQEWDAFVAQVRAPDHAEAFRAAASGIVGDEQLDIVMQFANPAGFVSADGEIDAARVQRTMRALFGIPEQNGTTH